MLTYMHHRGFMKQLKPGELNSATQLYIVVAQPWNTHLLYMTD